MISTANKIGIAGAVVLIAGLIVMLYPTSDTRVLGVGVYIQLSAFVAIVFAALRGSLHAAAYPMLCLSLVVSSRTLNGTEE
jgi:hypothetical protein